NTINDFKITPISKDGITFENTRESVLSGRSEYTIPCFINTKAPLYKSGEKGFEVNYRLSWKKNNQEEVITLATGLKIDSAIEIKLNEDSETVRLNHQSRSVFLGLSNKLDQQVKGRLILSNTLNFQPSNKSFEVDLLPEGYISIDVSHNEIIETPAIEFSALIEYSLNGNTYKTENFDFVIPVISYDSQHVVHREREKRLNIYNGDYSHNIDLKGGSVVFRGINRRIGISNSQLLGPPYGFDEFRRLIYGWETRIENNCILLTLSAESEKKIGITLKKHLIFYQNSPIIDIQYELINSSGKSFTTGLRSINSLTNSPTPHDYVFPYLGEIVRNNGVIAPRSFVDYGTNPKSFNEGWVSFDDYRDSGEIFGVIWNPDELKEIRIGRNTQLDYEVTIHDQESKLIAGLQVYSGPGSWKNVRTFSLNKYGRTKLNPILIVPDKEVFELTSSRIDRLTNSKYTYKVQCELSSKIQLPFEGQIKFKDKNIEFSTESVSFNCSRENPFIFEVEMSTKDVIQSENYVIHALLETKNLNFTIPLPIKLPKKSPHDITIDQIESEGMVGFRVTHPVFTTNSYPEFSPGLTNITIGDDQILFSTFPKPKPSMFLPKAIGGLYATFMKEFEDFIVGKIDHIFSGEEMDNEKGIKYSLKKLGSEKLIELVNVKPEFFLLLDPESDDITYRMSFTNTSSIPVSFTGILEFTPAVDLEYEVIFTKGGSTVSSYSHPHQTFAYCDLNSPLILREVNDKWRVTLTPPKDVQVESLIVDIRPATIHYFGILPISLQGYEHISADFKLHVSVWNKNK
ncbi:MAG: hypothetical protein ACXAD7_13970, partial [Candidatus Kariarchaeaceae archaeon]